MRIGAHSNFCQAILVSSSSRLARNLVASGSRNGKSYLYSGEKFGVVILSGAKNPRISVCYTMPGFFARGVYPERTRGARSERQSFGCGSAVPFSATALLHTDTQTYCIVTGTLTDPVCPA